MRAPIPSGAPARLTTFVALLAVVFVAAWAGAAALAPDSVADRAEDGGAQHGHEARPGGADDGHGTHGTSSPATPGAGPTGLALEAGGIRLEGPAAPSTVGTPGTLSFRLVGSDGAPVTGYTTSHERELHLMVVRSDGAGFRHVHPTRDAAGTWSLPWTWDAAGTYRMFADFVTADGTPLTLSRTVDVPGTVQAADQQPRTTTSVGGFDVALSGDLHAGGAATLTATVTRAGAPVTTLQPYLGAFGHLVVLRAGDLAFLHAHPRGTEPAAGATSGPDVAFDVTAPTPGRYFAYLDFQVDGRVHTAAFVLEAH